MAVSLPMDLAPPPAPFGLPEQERDLRAVLAFEVDAAAGIILGANPAGWQAWGFDPASAAPPVVIDRAMPALQRLNAIAGGHGPERDQEEMLTFWTARGLLRLGCQVEATGPGSRFAVRALRPEPAAVGGSGVDAQRSRPAQDAALPARLAHELRTPLSAVIAYAEVLKDEHFGPLANARYRSYARDIYQSAHHALGVVDGMLGQSKRAGLQQLAFTDLEPAVVVESCLAVARPLAEGAGLALEADYAPGLPRIIADEVSLRQMLLNLLSNAIKFARRGDQVRVAVTCSSDGALAISVADTGPGMEPGPGADGPAPHAATAAHAAGLGLGLPLTRALAAANGATLAIDSGPGQGTCVTISFGKDRLVPV
jgi:two-component system, cell cycle sensor histidine kinase PleC